MQPNTLARRGYKGKIYVNNTKKLYVGSETTSGLSYPDAIQDPEKIIPDPQH
jgi:hypothetical protein